MNDASGRTHILLNELFKEVVVMSEKSIAEGRKAREEEDERIVDERFGEVSAYQCVLRLLLQKKQDLLDQKEKQ